MKTVTTKLTVVYPCSNSSCMVNCPCNLCKNTFKDLCSLLEHKKHVVRFHKDCLVQKQAQCQLHWVTHPEWFDSEEDIAVENDMFLQRSKSQDEKVRKRNLKMQEEEDEYRRKKEKDALKRQKMEKEQIDVSRRGKKRLKKKEKSIKEKEHVTKKEIDSKKLKSFLRELPPGVKKILGDGYE